MKKLIKYCLIAGTALMVSCHAKKKLVDSQSVVDKTVTHTVDSSKTQAHTVASTVDSSKTTHKDSSISTKKEKIDILFYLKSGKKFTFRPDSAGSGNNDYMNNLINQALADADSTKIHIEREQQDRKGSQTTEQKAVKHNSDKQQETKKSAIKDEKKNIVKKDKKKYVETTPSYSWIAWVGCVVAILLALYAVYKRFF